MGTDFEKKPATCVVTQRISLHPHPTSVKIACVRRTRSSCAFDQSSNVFGKFKECATIEQFLRISSIGILSSALYQSQQPTFLRYLCLCWNYWPFLALFYYFNGRIFIFTIIFTPCLLLKKNCLCVT